MDVPTTCGSWRRGDSTRFARTTEAWGDAFGGRGCLGRNEDGLSAELLKALVGNGLARGRRDPAMTTRMTSHERSVWPWRGKMRVNFHRIK